VARWPPARPLSGGERHDRIGAEEKLGAGSVAVVDPGPGSEQGPAGTARGGDLGVIRMQVEAKAAAPAGRDADGTGVSGRPRGRPDEATSGGESLGGS
jgi:hypothetical protein